MQGVYVVGAEVFIKTAKLFSKPRRTAPHTSEQGLPVAELRDCAANKALELPRTEGTTPGDMPESGVEAGEGHGHSPGSMRHIESKAL